MAGGAIQSLPANAVDQRLLKNAANMSPVELSREIGGVMSPAQVATHVKGLLAQRDWLTEAEQDNLITFKLLGVLSRLEKQFEDADNMANQIAVLKEVGHRLDQRRKATTIDLNTYSANIGREMGRVYDMALAYMKGALRDSIDPEAWDAAADEALAHAQDELMKKAIGE